MVVIGFEILPLDKAVSPLWKSNRQVNLAAVSEMDLRYEYFWSRIEFVAQEVNIGKYWGSMPVLDFARSMRFLADSIRDRGEVSIGFTEHPTVVSFIRSGDLVEIRDPHLDSPLYCGVTELVAAAQAFVGSVTAQLSKDYPEISGNNFFAALNPA